jgi:hypothetical protein
MSSIRDSSSSPFGKGDEGGFDGFLKVQRVPNNLISKIS